MSQALYKLIILLFACFLQMREPLNLYSILPFLLAITASITWDIMHGYMRLIPYSMFFLSCLFVPILTSYIPLLIYDTFERKYKGYQLFPFIALIIILYPYQYDFWIMILTTSIAAIILKLKHLDNQALLELYQEQRDTSKELTLLMEERNHDLLLKQDYEIRLATLNERNRIAREIHDNVGHLLSSSLLQVGAIRAMSTQDFLYNPLQDVQETLNQAMNSIRSSVHDLHEDVIDLENEIHKLLDGFTFCSYHFLYDIELPFTKEISYHLISILKEALNNVMKHSNATHLDITIREQPKLYQIIFQDNGTSNEMNSTGMGLHNMAQRVEQHHGYFDVSNDDGFRIFITLPKEEAVCIS